MWGRRLERACAKHVSRYVSCDALCDTLRSHVVLEASMARITCDHRGSQSAAREPNSKINALDLGT